MAGNERADELAKIGTATAMAHERPLTQVYLHRRFKETLSETWQLHWRGLKNNDLHAQIHLTPPSLTPLPHYKNTRRKLLSLITQARTGDAFTGEYYSRRVPTLDVECPCGARMQTQKHIIQECPLHDTCDTPPPPPSSFPRSFSPDTPRLCRRPSRHG
jgi:hypothetical protein